MPSLKHKFQSAIPDLPDASVVRPSNWNDEHDLTQGSGAILGRVSVGSGPTEELTPAQVRTLVNVADGATANSTDAFLLARANHTGTQSADTLTDGATNKAFLATERTKLAGIATGATANSSDATLLNRANHTGTQSADTLTDGATNKAFLATERTKLAGIATGATANSSDATLLARANHTGTQLAATISDFSTAADARITAASATGTGALVRAASPTLTGTPAAPTAAVDTNTTQLATTAMVIGQAAAATPLGNQSAGVVGTSTRFARADHVHPGREVLTAARTYYVRSDGSDSNTGLVNSAGGAFLTVQKAVDTVCALDLSIYQATIQIVDGTYTGAVALKRWVGALPPIIQGNSGTPANVLISVTGDSCFTNDGSPTWIVKDLKVQTTTLGRGLYATAGGTIYFTNIDFGTCAQQHMIADGTGKIRATGNFAVSGSAFSLVAAASGYVDISFRTITFSGTVNYSAGTIVANRSGGNVDCFSMTFTNGGIVTGSRYAASINGTVTVAGAGATYLPGNAAGSTATGGQYA